MTKRQFNDALRALVVKDVSSNGFELDFICTDSFGLIGVDVFDSESDLPAGVYLHYRFYAVNKDYSYQGYAPVSLDFFREMCSGE